MSSSYNTPCIKHKLVVSIYSNTETSLAMSTLAIWCRVVQSRDVRSPISVAPPRALWSLHHRYQGNFNLHTFCL